MTTPSANRSRAAAAVLVAATVLAGCGGDSEPSSAGGGTAAASAPAADHIEIESPRAGAAVRATSSLPGSHRALLRVKGTASPELTILLSGGCDFQGCDSIARAGADGRWSGRVWVLARSEKPTAVVEASTSTTVEPLDRLRIRLRPAAQREASAEPESEPSREAASPDPDPEQPVASAAPESASPTGAVRRLVLVGDSLAQGIAPLLPSLLPGWDVQADAERSRPLAAGMSIVAGLNLSAPTALAISLFTNDDPGDVAGLEAAVRASVQRAGRDGCAIWATIVRPPLNGVSYAAANAQLMDLQRTPGFAGRLLIVPWAQQVARNPGWIASDGVHATPDGYRARAGMYAQAALDCGA